MSDVRRAITLKPYANLYNKTLINIRINGLEVRVMLINAGLGSLDGEVCISFNNVYNYVFFKPSNERSIR